MLHTETLDNVAFAVLTELMNTSSLNDFRLVGGTALAHDRDIAAMKIQAILGRAVKKDFWDIAELLQHHSISELISWHAEKYPNQMLAISIPQALVYFEEAESSPEPICLNNKTWEQVKKQIKDAVGELLQEW